MDLPDVAIDFDAQIARIRKQRAANTAWTQSVLLPATDLAARREGMAPARLNFLSLPAWLAVAQGAGVPFVPVRELPTLPTRVYFGALDHDAQAGDRADAWTQEVIASLDDAEMLRFEQCAPGDIKANLSSGKPMGQGLFPDHEGLPSFDIWGERFFETLLDLGTDTIRPYARPIVTPATVHARWDDQDGIWPVEFRVFVQGGTVTGVSAYYPQAPLDPDVWLSSARRTAEMAQVMVSWMHRMRLGVGNGALCADTGPESCEQRADWTPSSWGPQDFTLDFIALADGSLIFLEGGPGGFRTASPVASKPGPSAPTSCAA